MGRDRLIGNSVRVSGSLATLYARHRGDEVPVLLNASDLIRAHAVETWSITRTTSGHMYATGTLPDGRRVKMHRLLSGASDDLVVDHINHDTLDNRRSNLRVCTQRVNNLNRKSAASTSKSGIRGVTILPSGRYRARVRGNGRPIWLGCFETAEEARKAVETALSRDKVAYSPPPAAPKDPTP